MTAPRRHPLIIQPPTKELLQNIDNAVRWHTLMWERSGSYTAYTPNLKGLETSVAELNTLVGITTTGNSTVQKQLNTKANSSDLGTMSSQNATNVAISGGNITGVNISNSAITIRAGSSTTDIYLGGTLNVNTTPVSNVLAAETNLISYNLPASSLSSDGDSYEILVWGIVASNANNKQIKLKYGATTIYDTGLVAANSGSWCIRATIARTSAITQMSIATMISNNTLILDDSSFTTPAETLSNAILLVCTGQGTASNDITQEGSIIRWFKA